MKAAIGFLPFVMPYGDMEIPPLAPALLKSCLVDVTTKCYDFNVTYRHWVEVTPSGVSNWLFNPMTNISLNDYKLYQSFVNQCAVNILETNPEVIGFSIFSQDSHRFAEDICYAVRMLAPECHIVLGGAGVTIQTSEYNDTWGNIMLAQDLADAVVSGEAETLINDVFKHKQKGLISSGVQLTGEELINIPIPNFDDYIWSDYSNDMADIYVPITASKGCVRKCTFCDVATHWPKFKYRTGESIAAEIIEVHKKYKISNFAFTDSLINGGLKPFREMNKVLANKLPRTIKYTGQFICRGASALSEEDFTMMADGGCKLVIIGIESGSERVREHMNKKFTNDDLHYTAHQLLKNNIKQEWNIIIGYPTETDDNWQETINLIKQYRDYSGMIKINPIGVFQMLEGTPISQAVSLSLLQIKNHSNQFNWVSTLNPSNTFKKRAERWFELVELLVESKMLAYSENKLDYKRQLLQQQLKNYE